MPGSVDRCSSRFSEKKNEVVCIDQGVTKKSLMVGASDP